MAMNVHQLTNNRNKEPEYQSRYLKKLNYSSLAQGKEARPRKFSGDSGRESTAVHCCVVVDEEGLAVLHEAGALDPHER
jgi:hypothetical protein